MPTYGKEGNALKTTPDPVQPPAKIETLIYLKAEKTQLETQKQAASDKFDTRIAEIQAKIDKCTELGIKEKEEKAIEPIE